MRVRALLIKAATLAAAVVVTATSVTAIALPVGDDPDAPALQKERSIKGQPVKVDPLPDMAMPTEPVKPVVWPAATRSEVDARGRAAPQQVGKSPVAVSTQRDVKVAVETLGQDVSAKAGVAGAMLKVSTGSTGETTTVRLNYSGFGHAYGGDYGSRLVLHRYPLCALSTPGKPECRVGTPLPTKNNARQMELTADVSAVSQEGSVIAAVAGTAGSGGSYGATDLAPSGSWSAGDSSGDFTYALPVTVPAAPGGPAPQLAFAYSAGSVDGRTSATNNQASWVGDGWELSTGGFMERTYTACETDKAGGNQGTQQTGDMCWKDERYTISLGGMSGKLIKGTNGLLRPEKDDGSKIEKIGGFDRGYQGEHWKVTTIDGTQYFLGLNRLPGWTRESGKPETTNSVLTMPVYGNHPGEACNKPAYADSMCTQAYRWNVDMVVDPRGNAMVFYYDKETNFYQRNGFRGVNTQYDMANRLARIEYGLRDNALMAKPPAQVLFHTAERCLPSGAITCDPGQLNKDTAVHWPDVPFDRICNPGEDCKERYAPAFFTRKRLTKVVTQSLRQDSSGFDDVDSWSLRQEFPPTADGGPKSLWLSGVTRTGHVGGTAPMPEVRFWGNPLANRVDGTEGVIPITRYRLTRIVNEAGGIVEAQYDQPECTPSNLPSQHDNKMRCYPVYWSPPGAKDPVLDWFHKYVVKAVTEDARTGGPSKTKSEYQYFMDGSGWHYDSNDLAEAKERTWSEWRGYNRVRTVKGDANETRSVSEKLYLRGMDGDFQPDGRPPRDVWVDDFGGRVEDIDQFAGFVRETRLVSGDKVVSAAVNEPQLIETATDGKDRAVLLMLKSTLERNLQGDGVTWRQTRSSSQFNTLGLAERTENEGDLATSGDESCTEKKYLRNEERWMFTYIESVKTIAKPCVSWPGTDEDITTFVLSAFDGQRPSMAPTRGVVTSSFRWDGTGAFQRIESTGTDEYGRVTHSTDADGGTTKVVYTPATGNPHTVTTINRAGWESTTLLDTARGAALTEIGPPEVDPRNPGKLIPGQRADLEYDPLGRLVKVWKPGRSKADRKTPNAEYSYEYRQDAPSVITSKALKENEQYAVSYNLMDGMLRTRQTQTPSPIGGRILTDTFYDTRGNAHLVNNAYYNENVPSTELFGAAENAVPNQTVTQYDDLGRPLETILRVMNVEQWRTKTRYSGDITYTTPPEGGTASAVIKNALGKVTERRDYHQRSADGLYGPSAGYDVTKYTYDYKGMLRMVVDAQSNVWEHKYDRLGRNNWNSDPDTGISTSEYDTMDQLRSTTDARGRKLVNDYDSLGRVTATSEEVNGVKTKLTETVFDTLRKGLPTSSTRYVNNNAYVQRVDEYDELNRPKFTSIVIPDSEGKLAGTYQYRTEYSAVTGLVQAEELPAVGGLPRESIHYTYNEMDMPVMTNGLSRYVSEHTYSPYGETLRVTLGESPRKVWINNSYTEGTRRLHNTQVKTGGDPEMIESDRTYAYDPAGNITKMTQAADGAAETQCIGYDYLRRMTSAWTPKTGDCAAQKSVAGLGGPGPYWHDFTYDKIGNRKTQVQHTTAGDVTETYEVPASGLRSVRPHSLTSVSRTGPNGASKDEYTYDESGNLKTRKLAGNTQTLEWNAEGRVSKVTEADGKASEYVYDSGGGRLIKREPNATILYLPGHEVVLQKNAEATTAKRYYSHAGSGVAMRNSVNGELKWIIGDHNGTDELAITASNLWAVRQYSDPFGNPRGRTSQFWPDDKGLTGGVRDSTGLTSIGAREYDPRTGRFVSVDPIMDNADGQQIHGYAYANNSPVSYNDATGLRSCGPDGVLCGDPCKVYTTRKECEGARDKGILDKEKDAYTSDQKHKKANTQQAKRKAAVKMGLSDEELARLEEEAASKRGFWDVIKEELPDIIGDLTGFNDARDCFTKFDVMACVGIIPWGKVVKLLGSLKKVYKAVKKALNWEERVRTARRTLTAFGDLTRKYADEGMEEVNRLRRKDVDDAAAARAAAKDKPATCPAKHSFPPGTRVLLADGSSRPIEDVALGDVVLATDPETGLTEARAVVATWVHNDEPTRTELTIDTDGSAGSATATLEATDWHPFWVADLNAWVPVADIAVGAWLRTSTGTWVQVTAVRKFTNDTAAHDLTVDGIHSYHVLAAATPVLVHNCDLSDRAAEIHAAEPDDYIRERVSTVAVVRAKTDGGIVDLIAGSGDGLTPAQASAKLRPGEMHVPNISGMHAEQNAILYAKVNGYELVSGGTSRNICNRCAGIIRGLGGRIMGKLYPGNGKTTTRQRSFEW
nr:RHS repeat-associated core domain-containing protein [Kibdelosporangium sp. MJ126-NF4]CEL21558.1 hypothetical protein [Kibdelosporangium sp. MJ126-NF4]CTQ95874.1 hypothetical protein [Kibdelosporangium sp. MJ126-NF4]